MAIRIAAALREASNRLADIIANYAAGRREVQRRVDARREADEDAARRAGSSPQLNQAVYTQMLEDGLAQVQEQALSDIDQIDQAADTEAERVRQEVTRVLAPGASDDVVTQLRQGRIADRLLRILDAEYGRSHSTAGAVSAAVEYANETEDPEVFLVLRSELEPWLRAHDDVLRTPRFRREIDEARRPFFSADELEAVEALEETEDGIRRVGEAIGMARQAIRGGKIALDLATHLPGWTVDHDVQVSSGS